MEGINNKIIKQTEEQISTTGKQYLISETAKLVGVENHVLRYWEEELKMQVKRNQKGHRYYLKEDIDLFIRIKRLKEQGLQLKAIRVLLFEKEKKEEEKGSVALFPVKHPDSLHGHSKHQNTYAPDLTTNEMEISAKADLEEHGIQSVPPESCEEEKGDKARKLQMLLKMMVAEVMEEYNQEFGEEVKDVIQKEMDYQFRQFEERETEKEEKRKEREDSFLKKIEEIFRLKSDGKKGKKKHLLFSNSQESET